MTKKKRWLLAAVTACAILYGAVVSWLFVREELSHLAVTKTNYRRVQWRMTKSEVHTILGGAPYRSNGREDLWIGYHGSIVITFDENELVAWRAWDKLPYRNRFPQSILQSIQWPID